MGVILVGILGDGGGQSRHPTELSAGGRCAGPGEHSEVAIGKVDRPVLQVDLAMHQTAGEQTEQECEPFHH